MSRAIDPHSAQSFRTTASVIKNRIDEQTKDLLQARVATASDLPTDDELFKPYVEFLVSATIGAEHYSFVRSIGNTVKGTIEDYEREKGVTINKRHLYFGFSLNALYMNDTINAMIYWELYMKEEHRVSGAAYNAVAALNRTIQQFTSAINPITSGINDNPLYKILKPKYTFIEDFPTLLPKYHSPEIFSYFSSGVRHRQIGYWIKKEFTDMSKMYGQELINALCILVEASFKDLGASGMLGPILNHFLPGYNAAVSHVIGLSADGPRPATGLFLSHKTKTEAEFNTNFPLIIAAVKGGGLADDQLKGYLIYGAYMLRNKSLHDYNPNLAYYNNRDLFIDTIGLLFAAVSVMKHI